MLLSKSKKQSIVKTIAMYKPHRRANRNVFTISRPFAFIVAICVVKNTVSSKIVFDMPFIAPPASVTIENMTCIASLMPSDLTKFVNGTISDGIEAIFLMIVSASAVVAARKKIHANVTKQKVTVTFIQLGIFILSRAPFVARSAHKKIP